MVQCWNCLLSRVFDDRDVNPLCTSARAELLSRREVPDFVLASIYLSHWNTWNGHEVSDQIVDGVNSLCQGFCFCHALRRLESVGRCVWKIILKSEERRGLGTWLRHSGGVKETQVGSVSSPLHSGKIPSKEVQSMQHGEDRLAAR